MTLITVLLFLVLPALVTIAAPVDSPQCWNGDWSSNELLRLVHDLPPEVDSSLMLDVLIQAPFYVSFFLDGVFHWSDLISISSFEKTISLPAGHSTALIELQCATECALKYSSCVGIAVPEYTDDDVQIDSIPEPPPTLYSGSLLRGSEDAFSPSAPAPASAEMTRYASGTILVVAVLASVFAIVAVSSAIRAFQEQSSPPPAAATKPADKVFDTVIQNEGESSELDASAVNPAENPYVAAELPTPGTVRSKC